MGDATIAAQGSAPRAQPAQPARRRHALCLAEDFGASTEAGSSRMGETASVLVDLGWDVTVVAGETHPGHDGGSDLPSEVDGHQTIHVVRVPPDLGVDALVELAERVHDEQAVDVVIAAGGQVPWSDAAHSLWDAHRTPYLLDHAGPARLRQPDGDHVDSEELSIPDAEATLFAEALEVWFPSDAARRQCQSACPSLTNKARVVPGDGGAAVAGDLRAVLTEALRDLDARVESARAMCALLEQRDSSGAAEVTVFEIPLPSTRTIRMMDTLRAAGVVTTSIHWAPHTAAVRGLGFRSIPFTNRKYSLFGQVRKHLAQVQAAEPGTPEARQRALYEAMLEVPVPATRDIWQDLKIWSQEWFDVARVMVEHPSPVFWAADLNALPPAVWAKHALPGTRVILDAHELFTELDYLDPTQRDEWEDISQTFLPEVDLIITVGQGIADELRRRYGVQRVEVIESLAAPTRVPGSDVRSELGLDADTPLVVHIGNVSGNRNPLLAVQLLQHDPRLHFAFVGLVKGTMSDTLGGAAEVAGVRDRLHLVGSVSRDELQHFVSTADASAILYSPRTSENLRLAMPNKLFDALGSGVPCVASTGTTAGDYLQREGLGLAFADGDAASLAAALEAVISDGGFRARVRDRASSFLWPSLEPRLLSLVADELAAAELPGPHVAPAPGSRPGDQATFASTASKPAYSWRRDPGKRARVALAWRLRRLANTLER